MFHKRYCNISVIYLLYTKKIKHTIKTKYTNKIIFNQSFKIESIFERSIRNLTKYRDGLRYI